MLQLSQPKSIVKLRKISEEIKVAFEAASEQLNLLSAFLSRPNTLDHALIIKYMPNYSNQAHEMRFVQQECKRVVQAENLTPASHHFIAALELESLALERMSEKIVTLLRYFAKVGQHMHLNDEVPINAVDHLPFWSAN